MQVIVDKIRATLPAVNDDILSYITGLASLCEIGRMNFGRLSRHLRDQQN